MDYHATEVAIAVVRVDNWFNYGIYFPENSQGSGGRANMSGTCLEHTANAEEAEIQAVIRILETIYGSQPPLVIHTRSRRFAQQINELVSNLGDANVMNQPTSKSLAYLSALLERAPTRISARQELGQSHEAAKKLAQDAHIYPPFARDWAQAECALRMEILRGLMDSQESPTSDAMVRASRLLSLAQARALAPDAPVNMNVTLPQQAAEKSEDIEPVPAPNANSKRMIRACPAPFNRVVVLRKGNKTDPLPETLDLSKCVDVWSGILESRQLWPAIPHNTWEAALKELIALRKHVDPTPALAAMDTDAEDEYATPRQGTKKRSRGVERPRAQKKFKPKERLLLENPLPECILHGLTAVVDALCDRIQHGMWLNPMLAVFVLYMNIDNPKPLHCLPHLVGHVGGVKIIRLGRQARKKLYGKEKYSMPQDTVFAVMDIGDIPQSLRDVINGVEPLDGAS
ncbi:hypothetical protein CYLTODRAFT_492308 [Cylindrobasidium torrendii FP15055 ss-10]|uniref:Uncharacterized protein n=1 Tax=Cylindrobasidium torrendii FP15055 ss-10 TaxID=1314674 RepID=A0A0D7B4Q0_9AGAR|nr:hypothetical protein CYLTODRAFT_492308 [Cylindrobasidium torrendii FP15055 ss-10]